ncbi:MULTISPECIES: hypothetical protein [unclassified Nonomuraea]|uniref:hypothetical protein n=1 Tax=unclassified Nonomuraea TaxID=2593643 RepID=UPI0033ECE8D3
MRFADLSHGGSNNLDTERGQLTVNAPVTPRTFSRASRNTSKRMDRIARGTSTPARRAGRGATAPQQIAVPAQDGVRADQQPKVPEAVRRQAVKQPSEKEPISRRERGRGHLPLRHHQLVPQHQDFDFLVTIG